jgi:adenosylhomocysteine nucleosidase
VTYRGRLGSAKIAVLTITPEEFTAAQRILATHVPILGTPYYVTAISASHDYDLVLRQATDRTNTPANETVADLIEFLSPEFLLVVGTAGGVFGQDAIMLGDVVIADYVDYGEFRKKLPGNNLARKIPYDHPSVFLRERFAGPLRRRSDWIALINTPRPAAKAAQRSIVDRAKNLLRRKQGLIGAPAPGLAQGGPKAIEGNILAGEKIWGDPTSKELQELLKEFDKAVAVDTESYGVARAVFRQRTSRRGYNPQYLVVRGICDFVNTEGNEAQRRAWTAYAATSAAAFAHCLAQDLLNSAIW